MCLISDTQSEMLISTSFLKAVSAVCTAITEGGGSSQPNAFPLCRMQNSQFNVATTLYGEDSFGLKVRTPEP